MKQTKEVKAILREIDGRIYSYDNYVPFDDKKVAKGKYEQLKSIRNWITNTKAKKK